MKDFITGRLSKFLLILFLPLALLFLGPNQTVHAADVSNNISSLTVSSGEISDGEDKQLLNLPLMNMHKKSNQEIRFE